MSVYQPQLLDIPPMYVVFLPAAALLLRHADRCVARTAAFGAVAWYAWQLAWVTGLWLGYSQHHGDGAPRRCSGGSASRRFGARRSRRASSSCSGGHHVGGCLANVGTGSPLLNKCRLGPLRRVDCVALGWILTWELLPVLRWPRVRVLELLGRNSLQVFCAHIPVGALGDARDAATASPGSGRPRPASAPQRPIGQPERH